MLNAAVPHEIPQGSCLYHISQVKVKDAMIFSRACLMIVENMNRTQALDAVVPKQVKEDRQSSFRPGRTGFFSEGPEAFRKIEEI